MSIASRIESIEGHIEQAYDELQGLGADLTNVNKNIENISMVLDDIYDSMPQVSGEGTNLTLNDTRVGKIKSTLKGNTSQTAYSGKNLFQMPSSATSNGITYKLNDDGTFNISGTSTAQADFTKVVNLDKANLTNGETYTLYFNALLNFYAMVAFYNGDTWLSTPLTISPNARISSTTLTIPSNCNKINFVIRVGNGVSVNQTNAYCMLVKGSYTSSNLPSFEPYVGGTTSPNPDYPQDIHIVSGDNEIVINGKNLFNKSTIVAGDAYNSHNPTIRLSSRQSLYLEAGTYTFSTNLNLSTYNFGLAILESPPPRPNYDDLFNTSWQTTSPKTITINQSGYFILNLRKSDNGTLTVDDIKDFNYQLEKGSTASTYEPYIGNTYNIDLPVENLLPPPSNSSSSTGVGNMTLTWNTSNNFHLSGSATSTGNVLGGTVASDYTIKEGDYLHLCNDSVPSGTIQFVGLTPTTQAFVATINSKNKVLDLTSYVGKTIHSVFFYCVSGASADMTMTPMIVNGMSKVLSFTPYGTTPIELCKIGNYQDYIYKDSDKWYLHKEIGKVVFTGAESENWELSSTSEQGSYRFGIASLQRIILAPANNNTSVVALSNYFVAKTANLTYLNNEGISSSASGYLHLYADILKTYTVAQFKTWLTTNNVSIYYLLQTPTNTEITYQPLIEQLNLLEKAQSKENQTNISQVNNDLPFIISASALKEWQESTSLNSTLSMVNPLSLGNTLNTQENDTQPIEVDNIEPLEEEENEES